MVLTSAELNLETSSTAAPSLHCYVLYPSDESADSTNSVSIEAGASVGKVLNVTRIEISKIAGN